MRLPARRYGARCPPVQPPRGGHFVVDLSLWVAWSRRRRAAAIWTCAPSGCARPGVRRSTVAGTARSRPITSCRSTFQGLFGQGLRHVATLGATWMALLGWQAAALKRTARDRWIGWSPQQKRRRLHLVARGAPVDRLPAGLPHAQGTRPTAPRLRDQQRRAQPHEPWRH